MVTKQELEAKRQEFRKINLLFQAETVEQMGYVGSQTSENDKKDFEYNFLNEALNLYNQKPYNTNKIKPLTGWSYVVDTTDLKTDLDKLNKRPDISQDDYKKLLNNQEKHTPEDLKPKGAEDVSQALTAAEAKVTKLKSDKEELMKIVRQNIRQDLTLFFQAMEISSSLIGKKFKSDEVWKKTYGNNFDYEDIVDEKLTLENRESMKMAFKVVACICATEKAEELKAQLKKIDAKLKKRIDSINEN
ncbi:18101_t:CDS:2 [Cetraspora pellucida]|uniref:18101_t:CDS:1 n=1 Tax=Cetraspora pellucida TaxID=1433469 RepID=A0ACA9K0P3_9GLOM|nr:18101_t:CDS:2 [Cetraspora pellucida]